MKNCTICLKTEGKYKCPTCSIYYCSVTCFKQHKQTPCQIVKKELSVDGTEDKEERYEFVTTDTVPVDKLKLLEHDKELRNILTNPHLRNLLTAIDSTKNPEEIMQKAMVEPIFVEFADACLRVIEPEDVSCDN